MPRPLAEMARTFDSRPRNPVISRLFRLARLAENPGVSAPAVDREIAKMAHCLRRIGPKKGGRREIIPKS